MLATLIAGIMLVCMGILRLGILIRFIPYPVITGFTTGLATIIVVLQIKEFCGFTINNPSNEVFIGIGQYIEACSTLNAVTCAISLMTLAVIIWIRNVRPKIPGSIIALLLATTITYFFELPVATIKNTFGEIPSSLPQLQIPTFSFEKINAVFPDAIAIALLGAIESLLCCVVLDAQGGFRHKSNCELVAQGLANIGSSFVGGIAATGAIARSTANLQLGAKTPVAGMIHALTLLVLMVAFAPYASLIPLGAIGAVLFIVAYNMSELPHFIALLKAPGSEKFVLLATFILTVSVDLSFAVQMGVLLSAFLFLKQMSENTKCKMHQIVECADTVEFEIEGPLFFGAVNTVEDAFREIKSHPKRFVLRMSQVPYIDSSGIYALKQLKTKCHQRGIDLAILDVRTDIMPLLDKAGISAIS